MLPFDFGDNDNYSVNPKVTFNISELNIRPDQYGDLVKAANALIDMKMSAIITKEDNTKVLSIFALFPDIEIPVRDGYKYKEGKRRVGTITLEMNRKALNELMRSNGQYTRYIKEVTRNRDCSYTSRIYMFISTYKKYGTWKVAYTDFHKMLGFSYEHSDGTVEVKKYDKFSDVKRRVLDPAQEELMKMADAGTVDCYFTYEPLYSGKKTRGIPEYLLFNIISSEYGKRLDADSRQNANIKRVVEFMAKELGQSKKNIAILEPLIDDLNVTSLEKEIIRIKHYATNHKDSIKNVCSYSYSVLHAWLLEHQPVAEDISVGDLSQTNGAKQTDASVGDLSQIESMDEDRVSSEQWEEFLRLLKESMDEENYSTWITQLSPKSVEERNVMISVPSRTFAELMESKFHTELQSSFQLAFGDEYKLIYVIKQ